MATRLSIDSMLTSSPDVCGGVLRVEGTRVTLHQIVVLYKRGESAEEIASHYPQLGAKAEQPALKRVIEKIQAGDRRAQPNPAGSRQQLSSHRNQIEQQQ